MVRIFLLLIVLSSFASGLKAQKWKQYRHELNFAAGYTWFLGDLGGRDAIGTNSIVDLDIKSTRFVVTGAYRFKILEEFAVRTNLSWGMLYGHDKYTKEPFRQNRNLHFRSFITELNVVLEYFPFKDYFLSRSSFRGLNGKKKSKFAPYIFVGFGGIYFNPKAQINGSGKWHALQPLGTEGQGQEGMPAKYSRFTYNIPYGIGGRYNFDPQFSVGIEGGLRKSFSDYIDDVSTVYYDPALLGDPIAAELSDPSLSVEEGGFGSFATAPGQQRGEEANKDNYLFVQLTFTYRFFTRGYHRPKF